MSIENQPAIRSGVQKTAPREPRGFGQHTRGLSGEYAHEQGWGLDTQERARASASPQDTDGGSNYEYGARDFGDEPVHTAIAPAARGTRQNVAKRKETRNGR